MNSIRPYKQVLDFLNETIAQCKNEPNHKLPSERMLAVKFNASRRSVRLAYDKLIEKNLVVRVHGKGHITTGNPDANNTSSLLTTKEIYLIIPSLKSAFSHDIMIGISDFCEEHSLELSLKISRGEITLESKYINMALKTDAKGIILFPVDNELRNTEILKLSERRFPLTIVDRYFKNINASFVSTDNYNATFNAIKFLHSKKIKNFVYLSAPFSVATTVEERIHGLYDAISKYYGKDAKDYVITSDFTPEDLCKKFEDYLDKFSIPQVIIVPGVAYIIDSLFLVLNKKNISPTNDLKFMLFDNDLTYNAIVYLKPYIIKQRAYQIGYESAAQLYNQIYGDLRTEIKLLPSDIEDCSKKFSKNINL